MDSSEPVFQSFTEIFLPPGTGPRLLNSRGRIQVCAWQDCTNLITADSDSLYFCGHQCQRKWFNHRNQTTGPGE